VADLLRVTRYPPETFWVTVREDVAAQATVYELDNLDIAGMVATVKAFAAENNADISYVLYIDEKIEARVPGALASGLNLPLVYRLAATRSVRLVAVPARSTTARARLTIRMDVATPLAVYLAKMEPRYLEGTPIRDTVLAQGAVLSDQLARAGELHTDFYAGVAGEVARLRPREGHKIELLGVYAVAKPSAAGISYVVVDRDDVNEALKLDVYLLPQTMVREELMRVVALEKMRIRVEGTEPVAVAVLWRESPITIAEKLAWKLPLTPEEREIAEKLGLYDLVAAGAW